MKKAEDVVDWILRVAARYRTRGDTHGALVLEMLADDARDVLPRLLDDDATPAAEVTVPPEARR